MKPSQLSTPKTNLKWQLSLKGRSQTGEVDKRPIEATEEADAETGEVVVVEEQELRPQEAPDIHQTPQKPAVTAIINMERTLGTAWPH